MKYNVGDKYIFKNDKHAYNGCVVEIESSIDMFASYCLVNVVGNKDVKIYVNFNELYSLPDNDIKKGDIIIYNNRKFLHCLVIQGGLCRYNAIDEHGNGFKVPIEQAIKVYDVNTKRQFFIDLKNNSRRIYDKVMMSRDKQFVEHIDEIIRLLGYEVD